MVFFGDLLLKSFILGTYKLDPNEKRPLLDNLGYPVRMNKIGFGLTCNFTVLEGSEDMLPRKKG